MMNGRKRIRLGDVILTNNESYSPKEEWAYVNYLDTGSITESSIVEIQRIDLNAEKLPSRARRKVKYNSIIYSTVRPNQRHFGIIKELPENFLVSTGFVVIDVCQEMVDADYLYFWLSQESIVELLHAIAEQSVSTYPSIKALDIENLEIDLPPIEEQKKIASILVELREKIAHNVAINDNLQQQAAALFESWFVNLDPWNGVQPSDWENAPLGSFVEIKRGGSPRPIQDYISDSGLRWLKISDVTSLNSPFVLEIKEHIKEDGLRKTVFLHAGELVLSNSATPGIPKILDVDTCIHDGWLYFPKSELSKYYLYLFFKHIRKELVALGNGSVFTNLKTDILKAFPATKADKSTLKEFDALVAPLFNAMLNADRENFKLAAMRDALLPKLMSGEVDVSAVDF